MVKNSWLAMIVGLSLASSLAAAKPLKKKYGTTQNGKLNRQTLEEIAENVKHAQEHMTDDHYEEVIADPQQARNDDERLAGLSAREIFILVDRSGSMATGDQNPTGSTSSHWTRRDSARVAAESIIELALSLDADNKVDLTLWRGGVFSGLDVVDKTITQVGELAPLFRKHTPGGGTPLAEALKHVYKKRLKDLLKKGEPFTVIILTDGAPDSEGAVKSFFKKVIKENNLEAKGRETLAAFSFVRMGDDLGAINFLADLDDNLINEIGVAVDIVDTKEDNFLFGTGRYIGQQGVGPFALFWDALYD